MKIKDIEKILNKIAPIETQEEWDNSGFQIKFENEEVSRILTTLEISRAVIEDALENKVQLIVTHHPLIFYGIKSIYDNNIIDNYLIELISNKISVYSAHTPFDKVAGGNNDYFGKVLGIENIKNMRGDDTGICRQGQLAKPMAVTDFAKYVSEHINVEKRNFSYCGPKNAFVKNIGWCTGSGGDFIDTAKASGCDIFVTGDLKYHTARYAKELGLAILDCGHYGTEKSFAENYGNILGNKLKSSIDKNKEIVIIKSEVNLNPFDLF